MSGAFLLHCKHTYPCQILWQNHYHLLHLHVPKSKINSTNLIILLCVDLNPFIFHKELLLEANPKIKRFILRSRALGMPLRIGCNYNNQKQSFQGGWKPNIWTICTVNVLLAEYTKTSSSHGFLQLNLAPLLICSTMSCLDLYFCDFSASSLFLWCLPS